MIAFNLNKVLMMEELLQPRHGGNRQLQELQHVEQRHEGMFSSKMLITTIIGKISDNSNVFLKLKFIRNFDNLMNKFHRPPLILVHIWKMQKCKKKSWLQF